MMEKSLTYAYQTGGLVSPSGSGTGTLPPGVAQRIPAKEPYRREGVEYVEHNGQLAPKDAIDSLKMAVGLLDEDLRYDVNGDGRITAGDAVQFLRYGVMPDYSENTDFFSSFYAKEAPAPTVFDPQSAVYTPPESTAVPSVIPNTPINVFGGIDYTNPLTNTGTTVPTVNTPAVPTVNRTYGTYTPPDATQSLTGMGDNRSYGGFTGTGTQVTPQQSTFVQPAALDTSSVFDPVRQGLGSLFDRAKSLQGQTNYVNPFMRTGG